MRGTTVLGFRALKASPCGGSFPTTPPFLEIFVSNPRAVNLVLTTTGPAQAAQRTSMFAAQLELDARHVGARSPEKTEAEHKWHKKLGRVLMLRARVWVVTHEQAPLLKSSVLNRESPV